jgi:cytochrome b subunit of formate dehydrogenase
VPAETDLLRRTATLQAAYFLVSGLWPIVSRPTFEAVTGRKTDYWLVRTVGALASVTGITLGVAAFRNRVSSELAVLGIGSALAFGVVDVVYAMTGRISRVYLIDAAVEGLIAGGWASGLQRP